MMRTTIEFELEQPGKPKLKMSYQADGNSIDLMERVLQAHEFYNNHFPSIEINPSPAREGSSRC